MKYIILFSGLFFSITGSAAGFNCDYGIYGAPYASVQISYDSSGILNPHVLITQYGKSHTETSDQEIKAPGELEHLWISKADSDNNLELIIFKKASSQGNSKLINPHIPAMKEMWGNCVASE